MGGKEEGRGMGERLAIARNRTSTFFFGSRHDGLWRSDDSAKSWRKVESFPWKGLGAPRPRQTHGGFSFVVFDRLPPPLAADPGRSMPVSPILPRNISSAPATADRRGALSKRG